jgi:hypothetical protein
MLWINGVPSFPAVCGNFFNRGRGEALALHTLFFFI